MKNNGIVNIQGKDYMTVARRIELAHQEKTIESLSTDVLSHNPVVVKASVTIKGKQFTGISCVNPDSPKTIERQNPYEIAETSAVGRALGFAGYGLMGSIATADDMIRAVASPVKPASGKAEQLAAQITDPKEIVCEVCGEEAIEKRGLTRGGKAYHGIFCSTENKSHTRWLWN